MSVDTQRTDTPSCALNNVGMQCKCIVSHDTIKGIHTCQHYRGPMPLAPNPKQAFGDKKVPLGLVPSASIIYEADALAEGARKYGPYNWRDKAVEMMTYLHAILRHTYALIDGEDVDPESGKMHLGHLKASAGILADAIETGNIIDNRPIKGAAGTMLRERTKKDA